jgi:hypothetical protein
MRKAKILIVTGVVLIPAVATLYLGFIAVMLFVGSGPPVRPPLHSLPSLSSSPSRSA